MSLKKSQYNAEIHELIGLAFANVPWTQSLHASLFEPLLAWVDCVVAQYRELPGKLRQLRSQSIQQHREEQELARQKKQQQPTAKYMEAFGKPLFPTVHSSNVNKNNDNNNNNNNNNNNKIETANCDQFGDSLLHPFMFETLFTYLVHLLARDGHAEICEQLLHVIEPVLSLVIANLIKTKKKIKKTCYF
ncbi:histidine kinase [Reticulomyxa filosa]|uniref:Histidine kinase n=1 Tax=Reticulomyxa filosa TaxID=46433 RepID=X6LRR2_RETFI|nr:histidine kinase [Reticulomyxa filosa]|eukprot:ETO04096.1 histidine kinase [Reticulomyxa filosa]